MSTNYTDDDAVLLPGVISSLRKDVTDPIKWKVQDTGGDLGVGVDFTKGIMAVPLSGDSHSQYLQLRNEVRVAISPIDDAVYDAVASAHKAYDVTPNILKRIEEARINAVTQHFLQPFELTREPNGSEKIAGKRYATAGKIADWERCVEFAIENIDTKAFDSFCSGVRSINPEWSKQLRVLEKQLKSAFDEKLGDLAETDPIRFTDDVSGPLGFRHTIYAAQVAAQYLPSGGRAPRGIREAASERDEKLASKYGDDMEINDHGRLDPKQSPVNTDDIPDDFEFSNDDDGFGPLRIADNLPLTVEVSGYMRRKRKGMQYGRRVTYPSRLLTDPERRVFGHKVKVKGGIVVVDISGSMSLSNDDLNAIVEAAPAAVVLAYSECMPDEPNAWILANRGWRVKSIGDIGGRGNGVDGTALTWAIRHRKYGEDIIWISDGEVTGLIGNQPTHLYTMCAKLIKKHRIIMIPSVREAVAMFKANKVINKPAGPIRNALLGRF
jgi:hypothetical protein